MLIELDIFFYNISYHTIIIIAIITIIITIITILLLISLLEFLRLTAGKSDAVTIYRCLCLNVTICRLSMSHVFTLKNGCKYFLAIYSQPRPTIHECNLAT